MGDPPLVVGGLHHSLRVFGKKKSDWRCTHRATVPCRRRGCARFLPRNPRGDSVRRLLGRSTTPHYPTLGEERGDPVGVVLWVETAACNKTLHEFPRQLRVVGVLANPEATP